MLEQPLLKCNVIVQDDNVSIHTTKIASEWHEEPSSEVEHPIWEPYFTGLRIIYCKESISSINITTRIGERFS